MPGKNVVHSQYYTPEIAILTHISIFEHMVVSSKRGCNAPFPICRSNITAVESSPSRSDPIAGGPGNTSDGQVAGGAGCCFLVTKRNSWVIDEEPEVIDVDRAIMG